MGCLFGGRLSQAGYVVTLLDAWADHVAAINEHGLRLERDGSIEIVAAPATSDPTSVPPVDVALIYVDANSTGDAARIAAPLLGADGVALTLQNGVGNREALESVLGPGPVMGGLSYASAAMLAPGHVAHTHVGPTWLGEWNGKRSARLAMLERAFAKADLAPMVVDDIEALIWDKWILNSAINALCAITGLRQGEIPRTPALEKMQDHILDELFRVAAAKSIRLHDSDLRASIKEQCWKKFNKPSMLQHMEAGKRTEIDALNGAAVRLGAECGVAAPYNDALTLLIKGREQGRRNEGRAAPIDYDAMEAAAATTPRPNR